VTGVANPDRLRRLDFNAGVFNDVDGIVEQKIAGGTGKINKKNE